MALSMLYKLDLSFGLTHESLNRIIESEAGYKFLTGYLLKAEELLNTQSIQYLITQKVNA